MCGIARVWTALRHRRAGVARQLLDTVRVAFAYGTHMHAQTDLAFSQPTAAGRAFAQRYTSTPAFLVYGG